MGLKTDNLALLKSLNLQGITTELKMGLKTDNLALLKSLNLQGNR